MIFYKNTKAMDYTLDGDTNFFDIDDGVLQGDTLAPCLFIICQNYVLKMSIDLIKNGFTLLKARSWRYPVETMTEADYVNDIAFLANTPAQAESLLYSQESKLQETLDNSWKQIKQSSCVLNEREPFPH